MNKKQTRRKRYNNFSGAFGAWSNLLRIAPELFRHHKELNEYSFMPRSAVVQRRINGHIDDIVPRNKLAAIERNGSFRIAAFQLIRKKGCPVNIQDFLNDIRMQEVLRVANSKGRLHNLSDRTARRLLRGWFGIEGKPGRKPRII